MRHSSSIEDYLEAIMLLADGEEKVTVTRISQAMGVKKPSVTSAVTRLVENGLAKHEKYGEIHLTGQGRKIARDVYKRHQALKRFLIDILAVKEEVASEDACRMEHYLSSMSLERLDKFIEYVMECPQGKPLWLKGFNYYLVHGKRNPEYMAVCSPRCGNAPGDTENSRNKELD
jgi:DtxR family Mn-dependent transcriptional regulator